MKEKFQNFDQWKEVARTGNYIIKEFGDDTMHYYAVKPVSGAWGEVFRNDHPMHTMIDGFLNDVVRGEWIDATVHLHAMMMNCIPDTQFISEFAESYLRLLQRMEIPSDDTQSEEDILREDEAAEQIADQISGGEA